MKIGLLITVRLKSTRLAKKALLKIKEKSLIVHLIDRIKLAKLPDEIVLCTSNLSEDDLLEEIAKNENVKCFRGDPDDVLLRLTNAAKYYNFDMIINCTGDNPFVDPIYMDKLIEFHQKNKLDYSSIKGLPFGTFSYALVVSAMVKACQIKDMKDTEVWGGYFMETDLFKWDFLKVIDPDYYYPDLRLTVDTKEDFELITKIFEKLYVPGKIFSLKEINNLCKKHSDLTAINSLIKQKPGKPIKIK